MGRLPNNLNFNYKNVSIKMVTTFFYSGVVFTSGGSRFETLITLSGQALKAVFTLSEYVFNFTSLTPSQILKLFGKLMSPILNFGTAV